MPCDIIECFQNSVDCHSLTGDNVIRGEWDVLASKHHCLLSGMRQDLVIFSNEYVVW